MATGGNNRPERNEHAGVWDLLPWHANATLDRQEALRVEDHVAVCCQCQAELERCRRLSLASKALHVPAWSPSPDHFAGVLARIDSGEAMRAKTVASEATLWSRVCAWLWGTPRHATWVFSVQGALILVLGGALLLTAAPQRLTYETLFRSDAQIGPDRARLRIMLTDDITGRELRDLLQGVGGEIVHGPSATGLYTIALPFPPGQEQSTNEALGALRANPKIRLAEPIDSLITQ